MDNIKNDVEKIDEIMKDVPRLSLIGVNDKLKELETRHEIVSSRVDKLEHPHSINKNLLCSFLFMALVGAVIAVIAISLVLLGQQYKLTVALDYVWNHTICSDVIGCATNVSNRSVNP